MKNIKFMTSTILIAFVAVFLALDTASAAAAGSKVKVVVAKHTVTVTTAKIWPQASAQASTKAAATMLARTSAKGGILKANKNK